MSSNKKTCPAKPIGRFKKRKRRSSGVCKELERNNSNKHCVLNTSEDYIVRINAFGLKETLDKGSYEEALKTEKELNKILEEYLNNINPSRVKTLKGVPKIEPKD